MRSRRVSSERRVPNLAAIAVAAGAELGVSRATFDMATRGLERIVAAGAGHPWQAGGGRRRATELVQTPADYLKETTFDRLAAQGRKLLDQYRSPLAAIERWSLRRCSGDFRARARLPGVLATRTAPSACWHAAYFGKRKEKLSGEFLLALKSWTRLRQARRHEKLLGRRHGTDPVPAFGFLQIRRSTSTATAAVTSGTRCRTARLGGEQLLDKGWQRDVRWAYEVRAPADSPSGCRKTPIRSVNG